MRTRWKWIIGGVAVVVVLAVAGPFIYIHFIEGPPPAELALPTTRTTQATGTSHTTGVASTTGIDGTYRVGPGSQAGYRVSEVLIGQKATAVGRTAKMWGSVTVAGVRSPRGRSRSTWPAW